MTAAIFVKIMVVYVAVGIVMGMFTNLIEMNANEKLLMRIANFYIVVMGWPGFMLVVIHDSFVNH